MSPRGAPAWTGIVIGLLLGLVLGGGWLLLRERGENAAGRAHAQTVAASDSGAAAGAETTAAGGGAGGAEAAGDGGRADRAAAAGAELESSRRTAIVRATERVAPAVVSVNVVQHQTIRQGAPPGFEYFDQFFPGMFPRREFRRDVQSLGSGVIVGREGYVLTNHHVIENADEIFVTLTDGRQLPAQLLAAAPNYDLALLQAEGPDLPVARMGTSGDLLIGEWAIAIGSPFGFLLADTQPTVTVGVISALNRDIKRGANERSYLGMIQTDAAINPGNSGGPLVDADGNVVGINTFIFTESGGSIGLGFAVPVERARWLIRDYQQYGRFRQAWSGLLMQRLSPNLMRALGIDDPTGFVVRDVDSGSPGAKAGLQPGDVIRRINGIALKDADTVGRLVYEARVGDRLSFEAERAGRKFSGTLVLEEMPARPQR